MRCNPGTLCVCVCVCVCVCDTTALWPGYPCTVDHSHCNLCVCVCICDAPCVHSTVLTFIFLKATSSRQINACVCHQTIVTAAALVDPFSLLDDTCCYLTVVAFAWGLEVKKVVVPNFPAGTHNSGNHTRSQSGCKLPHFVARQQLQCCSKAAVAVL